MVKIDLTLNLEYDKTETIQPTYFIHLLLKYDFLNYMSSVLRLNRPGQRIIAFYIVGS